MCGILLVLNISTKYINPENQKPSHKFSGRYENQDTNAGLVGTSAWESAQFTSQPRCFVTKNDV